MIDGLINSAGIIDFELDLDSPSEWVDGVCSGGAVTVTLIKILDMSFAPIELNNDFTRADLMQTDIRDLLAFEEAIKQFSQGSLVAIEEYFDLPISGVSGLPWKVNNSNWEREIPEVINFWEQLTGQVYKPLAKDIDERWVSAASAAANRLASKHKTNFGSQRLEGDGGMNH
jgi:hypothetical protein